MSPATIGHFDCFNVRKLPNNGHLNYTANSHHSTFWQRMLVLLWVAYVFAVLLWPIPAPAASVEYVYDELGRLIGVIDGSGESAQYNYDPVGNILSIERRAADAISFIDFTPKSGPAGTRVVIRGTGFSASAAENTVTFNGTAATVVAATATQLSVDVPAGATTGTIRVTSPAGSTSSAIPFTITASEMPTISRFTPTIGAAGTTVTVTGTNFEPSPGNNEIAFNTMRASISSVAPTEIVTSVPAQATSGPIWVSTPHSTAMSSDDFIVPPGSYAANDIEGTGRLGFGQSPTVTINEVDKIFVMLFNGTAGQRVSLRVEGPAVARYVRIYNPDGSQLTYQYSSSTTQFLDGMTLPADGTYTVVIDPSGSATGSFTLTLYDVPPEAEATIEPDGPAVSVTTTVPGQNARLTFDGTAGQRVSLSVEGPAVTRCVRIYNPDGSQLVYGYSSSSSQFIDVITLPADGAYTIVVDPKGSATGSFTLTLYVMPPDAEATIEPGGPSVTVTTTVPGQNARLTFSGNADQRIGLMVEGSADRYVRIYNPDGSQLTYNHGYSGDSQFLDVVKQPAGGTYMIVVDPSGSATGSFTLTLYDVVDATAAIMPGGLAVTVTTTVPGQNARLTFDGTADQRISLEVESPSIARYVRIYQPDGSQLVDDYSSSSSQFIDVMTLPADGAYTILVDPAGPATGSFTLTLYNAPEILAPIEPGSTPFTFDTVPGQNVRLTFDGTSGQRISLKVDGPAVARYVRIYDLDSRELTHQSSFSTCQYLDVITLPTDGTYSIVLDPIGNAAGRFTLRLYEVPLDVEETIEPWPECATLGSLTAGFGDDCRPSKWMTTTVPGQNARLTFHGSAGQQVTVRTAGSTMRLTSVILLAPDGTTLTAKESSASNYDLDRMTLPATGNYAVSFDPRAANTGSVCVGVSTDDVTTINPLLNPSSFVCDAP